ncbi:hypothetical protein [Nocardioides sp. URHA0032]|uniref:hypothetical protein n=1 Tax=Nocardioides sp. URHA0032 TaxID=1380388 RepID=UPI000491347A|nr:hypothetical protein [Nocardioides sp. URHA0032]
MQDWIVPAAAVVLALLALGLAAALLRARSGTERELAATRAETVALRAQLDELERRLARPGPRPADTEFVITDLGRPRTEDPEQPAPQVGAALFTDVVLRETVVKAASLAHGVRRALDPESRNRIRFEMRREVKRSRKQRRTDTRQARREWEARERDSLRRDPRDSAA